MKRAPIPKHLQREVALLANAAYWYIRELDHPVRDGVMLAHELDRFRQVRAEMSYEALTYIGAFK